MSMANRTSFQEVYRYDEAEVVTYLHRLANGGSISVVERRTGFGYMDEETGYTSPCGQFWLASGHHDIRHSLHELNSEDEMAEWVMARANNCNGGHHEWKKVGWPLDSLIARENWKPTPPNPAERVR